MRSAAAQGFNRGRNGVALFAAEFTLFARMRIEAGDGKPGRFNPEILAQLNSF